MVVRNRIKEQRLPSSGRGGGRGEEEPLRSRALALGARLFHNVTSYRLLYHVDYTACWQKSILLVTALTLVPEFGAARRRLSSAPNDKARTTKF